MTDRGAPASSTPSPVPAARIDAVEFYWRPRCPFCMMLERDLVAAGIPLDRRNIWEDPSAAALVRSVADGNETVPTVVVGNRVRVNPGWAEVEALLLELAPHLLAACR